MITDTIRKLSDKQKLELFETILDAYDCNIFYNEIGAAVDTILEQYEIICGEKLEQ